MPMLPRGKIRGFTLFELVVVLVLLGVAAALIGPSFTRGFSGLEVTTAARDLVTRMRQARSQAISRQRVYRIILAREQEERPFYVFADEYGQALHSFSLPDDSRLEGIEQLPFTVSFYPNGRSSGAEFSLRVVDGKQVAISVDPITGYAKVVPNRVAP